MAIEVLLVDEDESVLDITQTFLERQDGLTVSTETDPTVAADRVGGGEFDAVVSDLSMPGLNGLELCQRIRDTGRDAPFLLFTGRDEEEIADREGADCPTAVVRKSTGTDQYERLAEHIRENV